MADDDLVPMAILDPSGVAIQVIMATTAYVDAEGRRAVPAPDGGVVGETYSDTSGWPASPSADPPPSQQELARQTAVAAAAACAFITQQVVPDQTHQLGYLNAASVVAATGAPPASGPVADAFNAQAAAFGFTPAQFATVATAVSAASMQLSAILATLQGACSAATTPQDLNNAVSTFESSISQFVQGLNSAGLIITVVAPPPIAVAGVTE